MDNAKGKVERPTDYLRERFWRGDVFGSIDKTNKDVLIWLNETANERVHGTHRQPVRMRWEAEISSLGRLPAADYDTSIKVLRKVYTPEPPQGWPVHCGQLRGPA